MTLHRLALPCQRLPLAALLASLLLACAAPGAAAAPPAAPRQGGTLAVSLAQDPTVIDPIRLSSLTERQVAQPVYEALFEVDPAGRTVPWLAQAYTVSDDLRTWRIRLRPGIRFHDGTALDAAAVAANFERTSHPANRCRCLSQMAEFKAWRVLEPLSIEIELKTPNAALPSILAGAAGTLVSPAAFKADPQGISLRPVGTGPFRFVEWARNSRIVFERNPAYWQPGLPYLDRLVLRGMQNSETREATFTAGQTDLLLFPSVHFAAQALRGGRLQVLRPIGLGTEGIYMNTRKPPLDDLRVRQAVAHAIDRALINRTLGFGLQTPAFSPFGPGLAGIRQPEAAYPRHDPARARALLADYGRPVAFTLDYNNSPYNRHMVQSLQAMWKQVGIEVELVGHDQNRLIQNMSSHQFEASLFRFSGRADPHLNAYEFFHSRFATIRPSANYGGYVNPRVDELLEQGAATADPKQRAAIYSDLALVLARDVMPYAYLNVVADAVIARPALRNLKMSPDGLVRLHEIWRQ